MKTLRSFLLTVLLFPGMVLTGQTPDTLMLNYHNHPPFAFTENGLALGIEVEIMNQYILWLKTKKKLNIAFRYNEFSDFGDFYAATKKSTKNTIGLGAVTVSNDKT